MLIVCSSRIDTAVCVTALPVPYLTIRVRRICRCGSEWVHCVLVYWYKHSLLLYVSGISTVRTLALVIAVCRSIILWCRLSLIIPASASEAAALLRQRGRGWYSAVDSWHCQSNSRGACRHATTVLQLRSPAESVDVAIYSHQLAPSSFRIRWASNNSVPCLLYLTLAALSKRLPVPSQMPCTHSVTTWRTWKRWSLTEERMD